MAIFMADCTRIGRNKNNVVLHLFLQPVMANTHR